MKRLLLALCLVALTHAETIPMYSDGYAGSTPVKGRIVARFVVPDHSKTCYFAIDSASPLASRGAEAIVTITRASGGTWTVTERALAHGEIVAKLNGNAGQGSCLLATADETTYPLGATFEASVR